MARRVGDKGIIISIGAHPINYKILVKNIRLNELKNVIPLKVVAWDNKCEIELFNADKLGRNGVKRDFGLGYIMANAMLLDAMVKHYALGKKLIA